MPDCDGIRFCSACDTFLPVNRFEKTGQRRYYCAVHIRTLFCKRGHIPWSDSKVKAMYGDYARCRWLWLMQQNGKSCLIKYIEGPAGGEVGLMGIVNYTVINKQVFEEDVPVYNDEGMLYIERFSTDCTENRNRVLGMKMVRENIVVFDADARDKVKRKTAETHKKASAKKRAAGLDADRLHAPKKPKTAGADIW